MRDGNALASKRVMRSMPERPATIADHASSTPMPTGETMPRPVTTTRRRDMLTLLNSGTLRLGAVQALGKAPCRDPSGEPPGSPRAKELFFQVGADVIDCLLHRRDLFGVVIGNLGFEFLLERHHELDRVERIGSQVVDERRFILDLGLVDTELLRDDFLDALFEVFHASPPLQGS